MSGGTSGSGTASARPAAYFYSEIDGVFFLCVSDYVIEEKTAVLQKRDSEGFGFVLRGAKGETMDR